MEQVEEVDRGNKALDWVDDFVKFIQTPREEAAAQDGELGDQFLAQARQDLQQFRRNHVACDYARATFWLQQAVEKAAKGFMMLFGALKRDDLQKVGHFTPLAFLRIIEDMQLTWLPGWLEWLKTLPELREVQLSFDVKEAHNLIRKDRHQLALLSPHQVQELIQLAQSFKRKLGEMTIKWAVYKTEWNGGRSRGRGQLIEKGDTRVASTFAIAMMRLYILGLVTYPHFDTTRYPDEAVSPAAYTKELGVVAHATTLASMLAALLKELQDYIAK